METHSPAWWQLYLLIPLTFGLIGLEAARPVPGVSGQAVVAGIVLLFFTSVLGWIHMNGGLLERWSAEEEELPDEFTVTVVEPAFREEDWTIPLPTPVAALRVAAPSRGRFQLQDKGSDKWFLN